MGKKIVIKPYTAAYTNPIFVKAGDTITLFEKESEWPGWSWFKTEKGEEGWIPLEYFSKEENKGIVTADYTTREFTVNEGDLFEFIKGAGGWSFCNAPDNEAGWIPDECLNEFEND